MRTATQAAAHLLRCKRKRAPNTLCCNPLSNQLPRVLLFPTYERKFTLLSHTSQPQDHSLVKCQRSPDTGLGESATDYLLQLFHFSQTNESY